MALILPDKESTPTKSKLVMPGESVVKSTSPLDVPATTTGSLFAPSQTSTPTSIGNQPTLDFLKALGSTSKEVAKSLYNMVVNPGERQKSYEERFLQYGTSPVIKAITAPGVATARIITRFINPALEPLADNLAEIQAIGEKGGIADRVAKGEIPPTIFDELAVLKKTAPQIIGDVAQAVLSAYSGGVASKSLVTGGKETLLKSLGRGFVSGLEPGLAFGGAQALSSGSKNPYEILSTILVSGGAGGVLNALVSGTVPLSKGVLEKVKLAKAEYDKLTPREKRAGFAKLPEIEKIYKNKVSGEEFVVIKESTDSTKVKSLKTGEELEIKNENLKSKFDAVEKRAPVEITIPKVPTEELTPQYAKEKTKIFTTPEINKVTFRESTLLKERVRNLARGAREATAATRDEIYAVQSAVIDYAKKYLPLSERGAFLTTVRNANSQGKLLTAVEKVTKKIDEFEAIKTARASLSSKQSKIGYLKKYGEFSQAAISDVKRQLGIDVPIKNMNSQQLDSVITELDKRWRFKVSEGLMEKTAKPGAVSATDEFYSAFPEQEKSTIQNTKEGAKRIATSLKEGAEDFLGVISTRLENIDPSLKYALRKFESLSKNTIMRDTKVAKDFAEKASKIAPDDLKRLDIAMKNGLISDINNIANKYGFEKELASLRKTLDDIYARAKDVKIDVGYKSNFFPRSFKQDAQSVDGILRYFSDADSGGILNKAFVEASQKLGRPLTDVEKVNTINSLLRGFKSNNINLSKTGALKSRLIETVTPEIYGFYEGSIPTLFKYIENTNTLIESRRFFGKHLDLTKLTENADMNDVIGSYVNNLVSAGKISVEQQLELSKILKARFSGTEMAPWLGALKNVGYLTVMSSPLNAITQFGDLALAVYRSGRHSVPGLLDATVRKGITRADLGIEHIASEFANRGKISSFVDTVFKAVGLDRIDRLGKETFINGTFRSLRSEAEKSPEKLLSRITKIFGDEAPKVLSDLKNGITSENVKYLLFNELLDFQPAALSEVPLKYLENPNGRILYALKTYMIKTWDIYRREAFRMIANKGTRIQGLRNLIYLSSLLMLFNAGASELQDFISGKDDVKWSDRMFDSFLKAFGFSRYQFDLTKQQGVGRTAAEQILPPTQLVDDISRDFYDVFSDSKTDMAVSKLRTIRDIPVGGKLYYWWLGRGAGLKKKSDGMPDIPVIEIPTINIPTINIPTI